MVFEFSCISSAVVHRIGTYVMTNAGKYGSLWWPDWMEGESRFRNHHCTFAIREIQFVGCHECWDAIHVESQYASHHFTDVTGQIINNGCKGSAFTQYGSCSFFWKLTNVEDPKRGTRLNPKLPALVEWLLCSHFFPLRNGSSLSYLTTQTTVSRIHYRFLIAFL